jgi:hypothetical protein
VDSDGVRKSLGSLESPVFDGTTPGTGRLIATVTIPAGEKMMLWQYGDLGVEDFELVAIRVKGTGYIYLAFLVDTPTSASDDTPSGTNPRWREVDVSCKIPFLLNTDAARVNPTVADEYTETSGFPTIFDDAGTVEGKVYEIAAKNASTTDAVEVEVWVLN